MSAAFSDKSKTCGDLIEKLRKKFPHYEWKTQLHSNVIRGFSDGYNIMITYFRGSNEFEVCIRGLSVGCRSRNENALEALQTIRKELVDKKTDIEKIIKDLDEKRLETN